MNLSIIWSFDLPLAVCLIIFIHESSINQSRQFQIIVWANSKKSSNTIGGNSSDPIRTRSRQELRGVSSTRSNESVEKIHEDNQPLSMNQSGPNNLNLGPLWSDGRANTNYDARAIQMLGPIQPETAAADLIFSTLSLSRGGSGAWVQLIWIKFLHICPISTQLRNMSIKFIAILDHTSMLTLVYSTKYSLISPLLTLGQRPDMHYALCSLTSERVWKLIRRAGSLVNDALDPVTHMTIKLWVALFTQKVYGAVSF